MLSRGELRSRPVPVFNPGTRHRRDPSPPLSCSIASFRLWPLAIIPQRRDVRRQVSGVKRQDSAHTVNAVTTTHSRRGGLWAQFGGPRANQLGMGARLRSGGRAIGRCLPMAQWTSPMARHLHCIPCRCDQPLLLPRWAARGQKTRAAKLVLAVYFVPDRHDQAGGGGRRAADPGSRSRL